MNWFYAQNGRQAGPVEEAELDRLVQSGGIPSDTLVWHSGLPNWMPYAQARGSAGSSAAVTQPAASTYAPAVSTYSPNLSKSAPAASTAYAPGQVVCSECNGSFPPDEVVQVEGLNVCARCKPVLLQKLREGVRPVGAGLIYAGFWIRFGAIFIDFIIICITIFFISLPFGGFENSYFFWLVWGVYEILLLRAYGATPGKMACGLRVVRADGTRISVGLSIGRYFSKFLSLAIAAIGFIMAAFDAEKRAMHDQICDTRVVRND